jgi:hypothetical protein
MQMTPATRFPVARKYQRAQRILDRAAAVGR